MWSYDVWWMFAWTEPAHSIQMMTTHTARPATLADTDGLARTLAGAFLDDPLVNHMFRDRAQRVRGLEPLFRAMVKATFRDAEHEKTFTTDGCTGVAMWRTPGHWKMPTRLALGFAPTILRRFGLRNSARALGVLTTIEKLHPTEPHWYLDGLAAATGQHDFGSLTGWCMWRAPR
jgi:hypothetical protein